MEDPRQGTITGLAALWRSRAKEHLLDIASDGYVVAAPAQEPSAADDLGLREAFMTGKWQACRPLDCLGECADTNCACSRTKNPTARAGFTEHAIRRIAEAAEGRAEVSYASLGCGLLAFDLMLLEGLLATGVPVTAVHLVDAQYDMDAKLHSQHDAALAQFAARFAERGVEVYAHPSVEKFAFRVRQAQALPLAVLQVDCTELTWVFDQEVKPMLEEVLHYDGLFLALTAREGAAHVGRAGGMSDAWGEVWRLSAESGRLQVLARLRYRPGEPEGQVLEPGDALPPAVTH